MEEYPDPTTPRNGPGESEWRGAGMSPPSEAGPFVAEPRPGAWPMVIGIIAIVLGCIGLVCGIAGIFSVQLLEMFTSMSAQQGQQPDTELELQLEVAREFAGYAIPLAVIYSLLSIWLVIGGAGLTMRKPWSPGALKWWAVFKIIWAGGQLALQIATANRIVELMAQDQSQDQAAADMMYFFGVGGAVLQTLWYWALPAFLLIWLARRKIREEVAEWGTPHPGARF